MTPAVYAFTVPGVPKGKQRPRFARVGRFAKAYTPKETVNYEYLIRHTFAEKYPGHVPLAGPVTVSVRADGRRPLAVLPNLRAVRYGGNAKWGEERFQIRQGRGGIA